MIEKAPTYSIAEGLVGENISQISIGDLLPNIALRDEAGRMLSLSDDHLSGSNKLLILLNNASDEEKTAILSSTLQLQNEYAGLDCFIINSSASGDLNYKLKVAANCRWPITGDSSGSIFASLGVHKNNGAKARILLISKLGQIRYWVDLHSTNVDQVKEMLNDMNETKTETNEWLTLHAPVLIIPNVLTKNECDKLIESFETGGPFIVKPSTPEEMQRDYKRPIYEHNRQDRVDHIIKDKNILGFLDNRIATRVNPMIKKAFAFDVSRREELHIARYVGERKGNEMGHRDNTSPETAYRRFALSLNLNDDYEGGEVFFKEYNQNGYKGAPGTAMIFSSSLLHEVGETKSGTRYTLISHLFNDSTINQNPK